MTVRSITQFYDDITELLLVLLVCMENIFKELFLLPSQGVSLSIADAKVDTFCKLTKHSRNFFSRFFNEISQYADFQRESWEGIFRKDRKIGIYMLQNMVFGGFWGFRATKEILHLCEIISAWWEKRLGSPEGAAQLLSCLD